MRIKHKSFPVKIEVKEDESGLRTVEGWASTFGNKDSQDDIVIPGAFAESLTARMPKMLWQHNTDSVIGVWDSAKETDKGLYVKGRILPTTLGNDAYELVKAGAVDTMSIGYSTIEASMDYDSGVRALKKLDLWEVSLVTFPANNQAKVTLVKAAADDIDQAYDLLEQASGICQAYMSGEIEPTPEAFGTVMQLTQQAMSLLGDPDANDDQGDKSKKLTRLTVEKILRNAGISRGDAKGILAKGFPAFFEQRKAADETPPSEIALLFNQFR